MTITDILRQRLYNQHLIGEKLATPGEVVRWFGAVQAQDFLNSLYAIALRLPNTTEQLVEQAIADKTIVRSWPMRATIHYMPPEEARWMLKLLAQRQNTKYMGMYRKVGLSEDIFAQAGDVLAKTLQGGKRLTRKELYDALETAGIDTGGEQRGLHILGYWSREGLLCLGPRRGKQPTFTLLDEWIPPAPLLEGDEALATLARRYFISHGPATIADFTWWTGLTTTEARRAAQCVKGEFAQEKVDGQLYLFPASQAAPIPQDGPIAHLLPSYDEFTVAYKDRSAFLDPQFFEQSFHGLYAGIFVDGKMLGLWKRTLTKDAVTVTLTFFAPPTQEQRAAIEQTAAHYGRFLGLPVVLE